MSVMLSLLSWFLLAMAAGGGLHANSAAAEVTIASNSAAVTAYWHTMLPNTLMPSAILELLAPPAAGQKCNGNWGSSTGNDVQNSKCVWGPSTTNDVEKINNGNWGPSIKAEDKKSNGVWDPSTTNDVMKNNGNWGPSTTNDVEKNNGNWGPSTKAEDEKSNGVWDPSTTNDVMKNNGNWGPSTRNDVEKNNGNWGSSTRKDVQKSKGVWGSFTTNDVEKINNGNWGPSTKAEDEKSNGVWDPSTTNDVLKNNGNWGPSNKAEDQKNNDNSGSSTTNDIQKRSHKWGPSTKADDQNHNGNWAWGSSTKAEDKNHNGNWAWGLLDIQKSHAGASHIGQHNHKQGTMSNMVFLEEAIKPGSTIPCYIQPSATLGAPLLRRDVADSIPMSTGNFIKILTMFAPASNDMATKIWSTLDDCEHPRAIKGETKACVSSVESMVEFAASVLGVSTYNLAAFSSPHVPVDGVMTGRGYKVAAVTRVREAGDTMTCHRGRFPFAMFMCHAVNPTRVYSVTLEGEDVDADGAGQRMEVIAVCHLDTSDFHPAKMPLHVKPGDAPLCHFISRDSILWAPATPASAHAAA